MAIGVDAFTGTQWSAGDLLGARRGHLKGIRKGLAIRHRKSFRFKRFESAGNRT